MHQSKHEISFFLLVIQFKVVRIANFFTLVDFNHTVSSDYEAHILKLLIITPTKFIPNLNLCLYLYFKRIIIITQNEWNILSCDCFKKLSWVGGLEWKICKTSLNCGLSMELLALCPTNIYHVSLCVKHCRELSR